MEGRKAAFAAALSPDYYVQDGVIPHPAFVLQEIENLSQKYGYRIANVFHAGDGNLHPSSLRQFSAWRTGAGKRVGGEILKLCVQVGGSMENMASVQISGAICRTCLPHRT